jgi:hypothetical protein
MHQQSASSIGQFYRMEASGSTIGGVFTMKGMSQARTHGTTGFSPRLAGAGMWLPERMELQGNQVVGMNARAYARYPPGFNVVVDPTHILDARSQVQRRSILISFTKLEV